MDGVFAQLGLDVELDGKVHSVRFKPVHRMRAQQHFKALDPVPEEVTLWTCWYVLNSAGEFPGDFEAFCDACTDYGPLADDPKERTPSSS